MRWLEVSVRVPSSQADLAGDLLLRFSPRGFSEAPDGATGRLVLRAYLQASAAGRTALRHLKRTLLARMRQAAVRTRLVRDDNWAEAWKAHARPIRIGRVLVLPTWLDRNATPTRAIVRLDPGMAFGSGEHASTQLCLQRWIATFAAAPP